MASNATARTAEAVDPVLTEPVGHGNSIAAWTAVGIMLVGALVGCVAFALHLAVVVYIGIAIIIVGLIAGGIMRKLGFGVGGSRTKSNGH